MRTSEAPPLDLSDLPQQIVERGMLGLPLDAQLTGFCQHLLNAGFPIKRGLLGTHTLHPRYGAQTMVWRPSVGAVDYQPRARSVLGTAEYLRSPIHAMRTTGALQLRRRLDGDGGEEFNNFPELRAEGLTEYSARIVPYDSAHARALALAAQEGEAAALEPLDGIFFSCSTDMPKGFDSAQLQQVWDMLPYLALALKARMTTDVAYNVVETYLGRDAGRRVLTGAIERGSVETIRAVIWLCDLRGFTQLADTLPRAQLVEMLDDYLEQMAQPVQAHGGQVLKFMGDGLLATFDLTDRDPAPICREALEAAAKLQTNLPRFNRTREAADQPTTGFGLALHLGEVLYGNIGASDRLDFTVVGPAVNESSRIQALCRPLGREVLISKTFQSMLGSANALQSLGAHSLRGVSEPQELFSLAP